MERPCWPDSRLNRRRTHLPNGARRASVRLSLVALVLAVAAKRYVGPAQAIVRGNLDDSFIVVAVYYLLRASVCARAPAAARTAVLAAALAVEVLQGFGVLDGSRTEVEAYWLGRCFDWADFVAYVGGAVLTIVIDRWLYGSAPVRSADRS